jgi:hypothetical protein
MSVVTFVNNPQSEAVARHRESTPLRIGEAQAPPAYLLFEHAILLPQRGNHFKLMAIHPAGESNRCLGPRSAFPKRSGRGYVGIRSSRCAFPHASF